MTPVPPRHRCHFDRSEAKWRNLLLPVTPVLPRHRCHFDRSEAKWRNPIPLLAQRLFWTLFTWTILHFVNDK